MLIASEEDRQLADLIERVIAGESIDITRKGNPVAELVPYNIPKLVLGAYRQEMADWANVNLDGINWLDEFPQWQQNLWGPASAEARD